jgi:hypothetical protein
MNRAGRIVPKEMREHSGRVEIESELVRTKSGLLVIKPAEGIPPSTVDGVRRVIERFRHDRDECSRKGDG